MRLFDARVRGCGTSANDAENLTFFGVRGVVLVPPGIRPAADAEAVEREFAALFAERERLLATGLSVHIALGVHARWAPRRGVHRLLHRLPEQLSRPGVVAVGELGVVHATPPELDLLRRQLALAAEADLPAVVHVDAGPDAPEATILARTEATLDAVLASGAAPERVLLANVRPEQVELARAAGVRVGISVGSDPAGLDAGLALLMAHGPDGLIVDGGLGDGACDVLAMRKAADALIAGGWTSAEVDKTLHDNAVGFFNLS